MPHGVKGGFPIFWREFGDGPEHAVLLHCALAHSKIWARFAAEMSDRWAMVAPDMPGHGRSAAWDGSGDIFDQVTAIGKDCLEDGKHLVGHSFGAVVALRLATEMPSAVRSLTLIEPVFFAAAETSQPNVLQKYLTEDAVFSDALRNNDLVTAAQQFTAVWGDGRPWNSLSEKDQTTLATQMHFIRDTQAPLLRDSAGLLEGDRLAGIACPTCLIRGADTNAVIPAIHETLVNCIPTATEYVVADAGHMVPVTHPDLVAGHVRAMLDAA